MSTRRTTSVRLRQTQLLTIIDALNLTYLNAFVRAPGEQARKKFYRPAVSAKKRCEEALADLEKRLRS